MKFFILHSTFFISSALVAGAIASLASAASPETRAVAFLAREVPRWRAEHPCFSCHNNGDAARALIAASRSGYDVAGALRETLGWLNVPQQWDANKSDGGFDNKALAHLQFGSALASAAGAGLLDRDALPSAAAIVAADQHADGSWMSDLSRNIGAPTTYGAALATASARRLLLDAATPSLKPAIERADRWLRTVDAQNIPDAAAVVLGLERATDAGALAQRARATALLRRGQGPDGGWGPFVNASSEPFDTAIVMLALTSIDDALARPAFAAGERAAAIARGRGFLIGSQVEDGSWPETTRPSRQESYAQRISTAGWATLALLDSNSQR